VVPTIPADAPPRFQLPAFLQVSEYSDWAEISRLMAPLYAAGQELKPGSPLQVEAAKIAVASSDPAKRAMDALRLVQDQIRYVALGMGTGGYEPTSADETWSRKYGDCKGKTVTLIALLKSLGIEAEPVLVSTIFGDALGERLPQVRLFDHVLVRAKIGGRSYWLDGTRTGDRQLDALASSLLGWGLPVRAQGAQLEQLPFAPPPLPATDVEITYDASQGFKREVPVSGRITFRGDQATGYRLGLAQFGKDELRKAMDELNVLPDQAISSFDFKSDEATGAFTYSFKAKASMPWAKEPSSRAQRYRFSNYVIGWDVDFDRPAGPMSDLPHALPVPVYMLSREVVLLPNKGSGFSLDGKDLETVVAGTYVSRKLRLEDGKAVAVSTFLRRQKEISAADARAAKSAIEAIEADGAYVRSPADYQVSAAEREAIIKDEPSTASGWLERGYHLLQKGEFNKAIADFDQAIAKSPGWSRPHANKAIALIRKRKFDEAEKSVVKAAALNEGDFVVHQGFGLIHGEKERHDQAVVAFTRSLQIEPDNRFSLRGRAWSYQRLNRLKEALADWERVAALDAEDAEAPLMTARLHASLGEKPRSMEALDRALRFDLDNPFLITERSRLLDELGRPAEAKAGFARALQLTEEALQKYPGTDELAAARIKLLFVTGKAEGAMKEVASGLARQPDNAQLLSQRCWLRTLLNRDLEKAIADCSLALEYNVGYAEAAHNRGFARLRLGRLDEAISDFNDLISWEPLRASAHLGRGLVKLRKGDQSGGEADLATARSIRLDVEAEYKQLGFAR
jgi:tetratricopeptide (TPR) repeat protein